jgi:Zn-dependent M28 family amino/carboxypeptidase
VYSAAAAVEAAVTPVDFDPNAVGGQGAGCSSSDFTDFPEGSIALLQPGPCFRRDQVVNAQTAGAVAVVVSYPDWSAGTVRRPTLIEPLLIEVPALAASHDVGLALQSAAESGPPVQIATETSSEDRTTVNVIAESTGGDEGNVVMVGGHLDSTMDGPGMNDNGSGTATILELAEAMAAEEPTNKVRFAFWGAEELGLIGSSQYVEGLEGGELDDIALYLNFDMLASPNFVRFVYGDAEAPSGSDAIAEVFAGYLDSKGLDHESLDLQGGSDHGPFARAGVPVGGLFTGATEVKSISQVDSYGGTAAAPLDACYHLACDTVENVNERVLEEMAGAVAHAVATFASSTEAVDG